MGKITEKSKHVIRVAGRKGRSTSVKTAKITKKVAQKSVNNAKRISKTKTYQKAHHTYKKAHYNYAQIPHQHMMESSKRYASWHSWRYKKLHHGHVHYAALALYILFVGILVFNQIGLVFAADLSDNWDFGTPSNFSLDSGIETSGTAARLKAQEYSTDGNTAALYHMNEASGTTLDDASANNNDATSSGSPSFTSGNMNNALSLNGSNQYASASDSSSLSVTGQQSLETWIKPSSTFNNNSNTSQTILDKGSYKLGLDRTSGKAFYEIENNNSTSWTKRLGDGQAGSWQFNHGTVESSVAYSTSIIAGLGNAQGDAEVWKWNGSSWSKIGGDGLNSSWADQTYETVSSLAVNGTALYAGLGTTQGDGEVWTCDMSANCPTWSKIGGDGTGIVASTGTIYSMVVHGGSLYVGAGLASNGTGFADLYKYNGGTSWTQIGGDGLNSGWAATTFETVNSLTSDGTTLYAGIGNSTTDAEVWSWNGSAWTKIGGDGLSSSWNTNYETVESLKVMGSSLYAGLGTGSGDGEVWKYTSGTWSQIGGDGLNSTWNNTVYTFVHSMESDGSNLYVGIGAGTNAGAVWKYNGSAWTQIGGGGTGWNTVNSAKTLLWANSKLYAGLYNLSTGFGAAMYEYSSSTWSQIGGSGMNSGWPSYAIGRVVSSTVHNGLMYYGLGISLNNAEVYQYDGTTATRIGGNGLNNSWPIQTYESVTSMVSYKGNLYVGLGTDSGDAEVWKWDGATWTKVGGDSVNSSWASATAVSTMTVFNGKIYAGLGSTTTGNTNLYSYDGSSWTSVKSSWSPVFSFIQSLTVYNNQLCVAAGYNANGGVVFCGDGASSWTQIGGSGLNSGWTASSSVTLLNLAVYKDKLIVGFSDNNNSGTIYPAIWSWNGSAWTQIGGNSLNSSWADGDYKFVSSVAVYNGQLYVGTGSTASTTSAGDVWKYNGSSWSQVGGDGIENSWTVGASIEEVTTLTTYKGKLYAGMGRNSNTDALVYSVGNNGYAETATTSFDTSWRHIAATYDGVTMKLYINGTLDGSSTVAATGVDNNLPLYIGMGHGAGVAGEGQTNFNGQIDEVRISSTARLSFTTKAYVATNQAITLAGAVRRSGVATWAGLAASETANGGTVTYRLSDDDGTTWKYWNGSAWATSASLDNASDISTINAHMGTFPVTFSGIRWQAVLKGDGTQRVQLNSVTLTANSDVDGPTNASSLHMYKSNGGDELSSNDWTNDSSPYFSWTAGSDNGAGLLGYCMYLGTSSSADPATTKGLLGTSTVDNGNNCQFSISSNSIDLATSGMLATALTTSNSPYYLNIKAIDHAGNLSSSSAQFQFRFDNTAPSNPGYITAPSQFVSSKEVTFTWPTVGGDAASDGNSGLSGLQYRIGASSSWYGDGTNGDGMLNNDGSYTTRDNPDYDNINEGNNTVYFRTWDQAGNVTTSYTTAVLKLNTSSPGGPQNVTATPSTNTTNSFAFGWDPPAVFSGSEDNLTYCYTINTTPTVNTCTFTDPGDTNLSASAYATQPGENTFYVVAKDEAGNINYATASSVTFTADTSAPGIPLDIDIADVSIKSTSAWKLALTWSAPTDVGAGVANYRVYRSTDNASFSQVASTSGTSYVDSSLNAIKYYYKVKACDSANNCGAFSAVVNLTPTGKFTTPATLTAQPSVSGVSTKKATVKWSTERESDSKIAIGTKSGSYEPYQVASDAQVTDHQVELANLTPGTTYYAKALWTDEDGNTGTSSEFSFKTDPAPSTQEVLTSRITLNSAQIRFTSVAAAKVVVQYGKSDNFGGVKEIATSLSKSTYDIELTGLDDGSKYFYRLNTYDAEGNEYVGSTVLTFTTPARPRIENLRFQPVEGEPTSTQKITWRTNVATSSLIRFTPKGGPGKEVSSSKLVVDHEIVVKDLLDDTEYTLVAESRDKDGNLAVSDAQSLRTALDTRPPKISDVTVETSIKGTGAEARGQVIVSWKTDEPSTSQVAYAEGSNATVFNNKTSEDTGLAMEHIVIVSDLPTSRVYSVRPISNDKSGNGGTGETKSAIIGRASDSVITIVLNTLRKVFGF